MMASESYGTVAGPLGNYRATIRMLCVEWADFQHKFCCCFAALCLVLIVLVPFLAVLLKQRWNIDLGLAIGRWRWLLRVRV